MNNQYAGKHSVAQQLDLLSKWLAESGLPEASLLVGAAALSARESGRSDLARAETQGRPRLRLVTPDTAANFARFSVRGAGGRNG
jgi:hypothetical protein